MSTRPATLPTPEAIQTEQARRHLAAFIRDAWHVVEPATEFVPGWHLDCIAEHLEAVTRGEIRNLLINVPPRHMKSLAVSVFWPVWVWTTRPATRWLFSSYAESLSVRDSLKCRRLIQSPWYQARWGHLVALVGDQNAKMRFENDRTGYRLATSVGGSNTGEGGDFLIADDPHNAMEAESEPTREGVLTWWDETMSTRGNDPKTVARVVVMQRVHEADLSGHVLERGGYHHLCLPARYEARVQVQIGQPVSRSEPQPHDTCSLATDLRAEDGALLWPERFGETELRELELDLSAYGTAGQLQQRPVPREGALFHAEWFRPLPAEFDQMRPRLRVVTYVDLAFSEKASADYTAAATVGIDQAQNLYLLHVWRQRLDEMKLPHALADLLALLADTRLVGVEEGAYKQAATRDLIRLVTLALAGRRAVGITPVRVTTDKVFRAQLPSTRASMSMVFADKTAPWWPAFETEILKFPKGSHDDQVDAFSGACQLAIENQPYQRQERQTYEFTLRSTSGQGDRARQSYEQAFQQGRTGIR